MTYSYQETKMLLEMVWMGIENGNREEGKAFVPNPEQYEMLCDIAKRCDEYIRNMQKNYGLE